MDAAKRIALLLADVDGTLVTHDKLLTDRARAAVKQAKQAGIDFAITSGRPPKGMQMLFEPLDITTPIAGFNGGVIVKRDLTIIEARTLPDDVAAEVVALLRDKKLDVWIYVANDWFVGDPKAPHVAREAWTVKFDPIVAPRVEDKLHDVVKIVGVSDDFELVKTAEAEAQKAFGTRATVARSQPYYLDVTHPDANKGGVLAYLAKTLKLEPHQIATIGDQPNDVLMFRPSGYSVAMGNAGDDVKQQATETTDDSEHEGFAKAVERLVAEHTGAAP
jgi:Cof subfamily protein (haloacid dehalogenase superfamily)